MLNIAESLHELQTAELLRQRRVFTPDTKTINFAGNDYLGLAQDQRVKKAFGDAANRYGLGSGGSAMLTGYHPAHQQLEQRFAEYLGRERALLFNSGYHANIGVMTALATRHTTVVADKHCHASMLDGIQLSRAQLRRYHHLDLAHADQLLTDHAILATESVFSMSGEISDLAAAKDLARSHQATLIIDDAHGFGVIDNIYKDIDVLITPLGKALGSMGAIVSGKQDVIEFILQKARSYYYSTALPPAVCAGSFKALQLLATEKWRRVKLLSLCAYFIRECENRNLPLVSKDITPVKAIPVGDNYTVLSLQEKLLASGFLTAAIRPPTVPQHSARIRVSLNISHTEAQIASLLDCVASHHGMQ